MWKVSNFKLMGFLGGRTEALSQPKTDMCQCLHEKTIGVELIKGLSGKED